MVYVAQNLQKNKKGLEIPFSSDSSLLNSARRIYHTFCLMQPTTHRRPFGVAIHRNTHRGQLIFSPNPILLPGECFVGIKHLEGEPRYRQDNE